MTGRKVKMDSFEASKREVYRRLSNNPSTRTKIITIPFRKCDDVPKFLRMKRKFERNTRKKEIVFG